MIKKNTKFPFYLLMLSLFFTFGTTEENQIVTNDKLINGDFEQDLSIGWQIENKDYNGFSNIEILSVNKNDYAYVKKDFSGFAELFQILKLDNLNQNLSLRLKLNAYTNRDGYSATSAFILSFLDKDDKILAESRIAYSTNKLSNTPTLYIYPAKPGEWETYKLNLKEELTKHFAKSNIAKIKSLKIGLNAYGSKAEGC